MKGLLYIIAYILVAVFAPIGVIYGIIRNPRGVADKLFKMAISLDQFGNVAMEETFNDILGKGFGDEDETVSSVLGKNKEAGTLKLTGKLLSFILNKLDKNHVEKSIEQ
jgi:hypothetical protein